MLLQNDRTRNRQWEWVLSLSRCRTLPCVRGPGHKIKPSHPALRHPRHESVGMEFYFFLFSPLNTKEPREKTTVTVKFVPTGDSSAIFRWELPRTKHGESHKQPQRYFWKPALLAWPASPPSLPATPDESKDFTSVLQESYGIKHVLLKVKSTYLLMKSG